MGFATDKRPRQLGVNPLIAEKIPAAFACQAPAGTGVTSEEYVAKTRRVRFNLVNVAIATTDNGVNGAQGSLKFADFNFGLVAILGAISNLSISAAAGIGATAAVVGSIGTVAAGAGDATLTSTEANIIPSTTCTLTSSAGVMDGEFTAAAALDGTTTAIDAYLNFAVPDAGSTANSTITVNGTIDLYVLFLGDND